MPTYGGIDLGGTKIQAVIVDDGHNVLGSARRPTPTTGGPADVAAEMEVALRDAAEAAEIEPAALDGIGVGSPGTIDDGRRHERAQPARLGRHVPAGGDARGARSGRQVRVGNDVQVATDAEFEARRRAAV